VFNSALSPEFPEKPILSKEELLANPCENAQVLIGMGTHIWKELEHN